MTSDKKLTRAEVFSWLETSCAEQGVPLHVEDRTALRQVGILLGMGTDGLDGAEAARTTSAKAERARRPARQDRGRAS
jgi:phosphatidylserine synthase